MDGKNLGFELNPNGELTFIGKDGTFFLLNGVADISVNKACKITFSLFVNGIDSGYSTPHTFTAASKTENISIAAGIELKKFDILKVYAKADLDNVDLTITNLNTVYWGAI